jgi:hypothetical protein
MVTIHQVVTCFESLGRWGERGGGKATLSGTNPRFDVLRCGGNGGGRKAEWKEGGREDGWMDGGREGVREVRRCSFSRTWGPQFNQSSCRFLNKPPPLNGPISKQGLSPFFLGTKKKKQEWNSPCLRVGRGVQDTQKHGQTCMPISL